MSGVISNRQSCDLATAILKGIVALDNPNSATSYINDSSFVRDTNYEEHLFLSNVWLNESRRANKYRCFRSISPAAIAVRPTQFITYNLLNEQLFIYFTKLLPEYISKNQDHPGTKQVQSFIDECIDLSKKDNLQKTRTLINSIESIRIDNIQTKSKFKLYLDGKSYLHFSELKKFNATAKQLGVKLRAWSTTDYVTLDKMLQQMVEAVHYADQTILASVVDYVGFLEQFLLMPISEAIKPLVDPRVKERQGDTFYIEFFKVLRYCVDLSEAQEFFMLKPKHTVRFPYYW